MTTYLPLILAFVFLSNLFGLEKIDSGPQVLLIPFESLADKIVVKARVNQRLGYFIIDTGYPYLALNNQIFKDKFSQSSAWHPK